ncbi:ABC transporter [Streptomyces sp. NPDC001584]|uniref:ABC transporter n=1 Tax=Streptomyces sp. NPDC001584 TaxID=3154521 RepID=UPI00331A06F3
MTALLRYQGALLLRSQRWLAPLITYAAFVAVAIRPGDPVADSLGLAAAGLVPATAWLVRICVSVEPDAARDCTAAAAGPVRVHAAALLTASAAALLAGAGAAAVTLLTGDRAGAGPGAAVLAGALATAACALTGAAVGALCSRPLIRRRGYAVLAGTLGSLLALVLAASPARGAVSALVTAGRSGPVPLPLPALAGALLLAAGAGTTACLTAARRR